MGSNWSIRTVGVGDTDLHIDGGFAVGQPFVIVAMYA